jgi:hypothetical protein
MVVGLNYFIGSRLQRWGIGLAMTQGDALGCRRSAFQAYHYRPFMPNIVRLSSLTFELGDSSLVPP